MINKWFYKNLVLKLPIGPILITVKLIVRIDDWVLIVGLVKFWWYKKS